MQLRWDLRSLASFFCMNRATLNFQWDLTKGTLPECLLPKQNNTLEAGWFGSWLCKWMNFLWWKPTSSTSRLTKLLTVPLTEWKGWPHCQAGCIISQFHKQCVVVHTLWLVLIVKNSWYIWKRCYQHLLNWDSSLLSTGQAWLWGYCVWMLWLHVRAYFKFLSFYYSILCLSVFLSFFILFNVQLIVVTLALTDLFQTLGWARGLRLAATCQGRSPGTRLSAHPAGWHPKSWSK